MKKKVLNAVKVIAFVLVVLIAASGGIYGYFTYDKGEFEYSDGTKAGTVEITSYIGDSVDIKIPKRLRFKKVTSIGEGCFQDKKITSVTISDTVTVIGKQAFSGCTALKSVSLGSNVTTIAESAFLGCKKLSSIKLGANVEKIEQAAFADCTQLENFDVSSNNYFINKSNVIYSKDMTELVFALKNADLSSFSLPDSVTSLNGYAFYGHTELKTFSFNNNIKSIPEGLFTLCTSLKTVNLSSSVISIGSMAIMGCTSIAEITIPKTVIKLNDGALFIKSDDKNSEKSIYPSVKCVKDSNAYEYCVNNKIDYTLIKDA